MTLPLEAYAAACLDVGVNIGSGQALVIQAPLEASELVHHLARGAYRRGAGPVEILFEDPNLLRIWLDESGAALGGHGGAGLTDLAVRSVARGAAHLKVLAPRPDLLTGVDPQQVARAHWSLHGAEQPLERIIRSSRSASCQVLHATASWAGLVFPELTPGSALDALWAKIFDASGLAAPEGLAKRAQGLSQLRDSLQAMSFDSLRLWGTDVDLSVGLAKGHRWRGGTEPSRHGGSFLPNLAIGPLGTAPHRSRVEGWVRASRPLAIAGALVEDLRVVFTRGEVVEVAARTGQAAMERLLDGEPSVRRLGKIALAAWPANGPDQRAYYNPLLDAQTQCHLAFGGADAGWVAGPRSKARANVSVFLIDAMIGAEDLAVDGLDRNGGAVPIIRRGAFVLTGTDSGSV